MTRYEIIIYWSKEDKSFIAEVPELPGCMADGETYQETLANVEVIIKEWIDTAKSQAGRFQNPRAGCFLPELRRRIDGLEFCYFRAKPALMKMGPESRLLNRKCLKNTSFRRPYNRI